MPPDLPPPQPAAYFRYRGYLLRLWQETPQAPWRVSLRSVTSGEQYHFTDLAGLSAFLQDQMKLEVDEVEAERSYPSKKEVET